MKVLQVIDELRIGGAEKLLVEMVPVFIRKGVETTVLILTDRYAKLVETLTEQGVEVVTLSHGSTFNPALPLKLARFLKTREFDVIHVHLFPAQPYVVLAKMLSESKAQLITTEHSPDNNRRKLPLVKYLDRWTYRHYEKVISISEDANKRLQQNIGMNGGRFGVITNGVDLSTIRNAQPLEDMPHPSIFMCAGFKAPKDQATVIKALAYLPKDFHVVFAGGYGNAVEQKRFEDCKALVQEMEHTTPGITERVHFLGNRMDVPRLVKSVDYNVLSSGYEGISLSAVEAMASGHPFIASDVHGLHEQVEDAAPLFPFGDSKALADIILKMEADKAYKQEVIDRCLRRATDFDIDKMVNAYIEAYGSL